MKVIFLDIDGVLNPGCNPFNPGMISQLNRVTTQTGACIVIHSTWRYRWNLEELQAILKREGVTGDIVATCPTPLDFSLNPGGMILVSDGGWERFAEGAPSTDERAIAIWRWMKDNGEPERFVIFDDMNTLGHYVGTKNFLRTNQLTGITPELANQAIEILNS